ncbi:hypothetical protein [Catellatospora sichuanensis]|uniref:hypothetical protein n=1 Tax=Catellatospora sichuanensis TaxID=1969805 RepID=UPI001183159B|nr:hypothetical protein [Catellatospora sichuanensis]
MYDNRFGDQSYLDWLTLNPYEGLSHRLRVLADTAAILDEMHSGRRTGVPVAHGDVKPATVVVRPDGSSSPADLGQLWTVDGSLVAARSTPYAAPELFAPGAVTGPAADRFAFAATVAHAALGGPPPVRFANQGPDLQQLAEQLRTHPLCAAFPAFQHRILNALVAPPADRPHSLATWLEALLNDLTPPTLAMTGGLPLAPGPYPPPGDTLPPWSPPPSKSTSGGSSSQSLTWVLAGVAALVALVLVGGGAWYLIQQSGGPDDGDLVGTPTRSAYASAAPSPTPSGASDDLTAARAFLSGTWEGTYRCRQGLTGMKLTVFVVDDHEVEATFEFYPVSSNPDVPRGSSVLKGTYTATGFTLRPDHWIKRPGDYVLVGLEASFSPRAGQSLRGEVTHAGCSDFEVKKSSTDTRRPPV